MENRIIMDEVVQIYLEGQRALQPVNWMSQDLVQYFLGDEKSQIQINDYRENSNINAIRAIAGEVIDDFGAQFSKPAHVKVSMSEDSVQVDLRSTDAESDQRRLLWIGVFEGERIQANPITWYELRDIEDNRTAFVAIVDPINEIT